MLKFKKPSCCTAKKYERLAPNSHGLCCDHGEESGGKGYHHAYVILICICYRLGCETGFPLMWPLV